MDLSPNHFSVKIGQRRTGGRVFLDEERLTLLGYIVSEISLFHSFLLHKNHSSLCFFSTFLHSQLTVTFHHKFWNTHAEQSDKFGV